MNRCRNPDHPHCTVWVSPDEATCAHGHAQPSSPGTALPASFDAIAAVREGRAAPPATAEPLAPLYAPVPGRQRPQLHISGFDPRAAGGRQTIRLELRGMPMACAPEVRMVVRSALRLHGGERGNFQRTSRGDWRPLFLEFSSRGLEHGQYRIEIELHETETHARQPHASEARRSWTCSPVILVPRQDASLGEIHQTFLATHKNVRVSADDAGIARVRAPGGGRIDIDISARNASIAQLDLSDGQGDNGKVDLSMPTIAWTEDLIEIDQPAHAARHPCPLDAACLVHAEADSATQRHVRLFALDECVLGRLETIEPEADLLLAHHGEAGIEHGGLTRRLSGRHAVIRRGRTGGFEIEDVSRYGLLLDGVWPGKHMPTPMRLGMRIELTASIKGVVTLEVTALLAHAVVLHRTDAGARAECFYLMAPESEPAAGLAAAGAMQPRAAALPLLFHRDGGFWQRDGKSGQDTPLAPDASLGRLQQHGVGIGARFAALANPELHANWRGAGDRRPVLPARPQPAVLNG